MKVLWHVLLTYCLLQGTAYAQTVGASLQGTVYDQSGAFVPNVTIEIRSVDKGTLHTVTTDDRGRFREPLLLPGTYELEAEAPGFQPLVVKDIQLTVGQDAVLDV